MWKGLLGRWVCSERERLLTVSEHVYNRSSISSQILVSYYISKNIATWVGSANDVNTVLAITVAYTVFSSVC